mmetsp:Transcript_119661/g.345893  ORF Transcript_119661/g.345893 Transcript_119661/m.345893 type:complete len:204 (+) Transcript_119661:434-1045(+)
MLIRAFGHAAGRLRHAGAPAVVVEEARQSWAGDALRERQGATGDAPGCAASAGRRGGAQVSRHLGDVECGWPSHGLRPALPMSAANACGRAHGRQPSAIVRRSREPGLQLRRRFCRACYSGAGVRVRWPSCIAGVSEWHQRHNPRLWPNWERQDLFLAQHRPSRRRRRLVAPVGRWLVRLHQAGHLGTVRGAGRRCAGVQRGG